MGAVYLPPLSRQFSESSLTVVGILDGPWTFSMVGSFILGTLLVGSFLTQDTLQVVRYFMRGASWDCLGLAAIDLRSASRARPRPRYISMDFLSRLFESILHFFQSLVVIVCAHGNHLALVFRSLKWVDRGVSLVLVELNFSWVEHCALTA